MTTFCVSMLLCNFKLKFLTKILNNRVLVYFPMKSLSYKIPFCIWCIDSAFNFKTRVFNAVLQTADSGPINQRIFSFFSAIMCFKENFKGMEWCWQSRKISGQKGIIIAIWGPIWYNSQWIQLHSEMYFQLFHIMKIFNKVMRFRETLAKFW